MTNRLTDKKCVPCEGGMPAMTRDEVDAYLKETPGWTYLNSVVPMISREWQLADFQAAMAFVNKVAATADAEGHHPNIHIFYNKVRLENTTHAIHGLSENDFILAAKINQLME